MKKLLSKLGKFAHKKTAKYNSLKNFCVIFFLGIASGLPLALILSTLKAMLSDVGFDLKTIGFLSLVTLPYTFKFCFAPILDSCSVPYLTKIFGQRKSWIVLSQALLICAIALLGVAGNEKNLSLIVVFSFLVALASASQDAVIDGYRIELIHKDEQGPATSFYVYGYQIGLLISGAGALILADIFSWKIVYAIMSAAMLIGVVTILLADETRKNWQPKNYNFVEWFKHSVIEPFAEFSHHDKWLSILLFIVCFKLCDAFSGNLTTPFLLELKFSKTEIASIVKTFGLFATLFGVFAGGMLVKKLGMLKSLWIAAVAQMLSNLAFSYLAQVGYNVEVLYFVIFVENFSGGIGNAVFIAYLSSLCNVSFSATQYALLVSLATLARSLLSSSAGVFAESFGWYNFFIFSTALALPALVLLTMLSLSPEKKGNKKK